MKGKDAGRRSGQRSQFVVVANRLAVERTFDDQGSASWQRSPGGLVTALAPLMRGSDRAWVGWPGAPDEQVAPFEHEGIAMVPVPLAADEVADHYEGMANATLWPLYHDAVAFPVYHREWWDAYERVNRRFAEAAAATVADGGAVWVQDYHLQLVPGLLRELRPDVRVGFFLHIPFPPAELFLQLPWRQQILAGLAGADVVGFQVPGAVSNFLGLVRRLLGWEVHGREFTRPDGSRGQAGAFPISIDAKAFDALARRPDVVARSRQIREELGARTVFLGVDRLDYTKGIRRRIRAFGELFEEGALDPADAVFLQVASPSRIRVEEYRRLRDDIDQLVGRFNGDLGDVGGAPIRYLHQSMPLEEVVALYGVADVMVVTPLRDGMNLVAKEYVASRPSGDGALVLSEFAGAARQLKHAWQVNPYDIDGMKRAILSASRAPRDERRKRMAALRRQVATHDLDRWAESFLRRLRDRPPASPTAHSNAAT